MKVWKIASRWSYDGNVDSSVLNLFRSKKTVFIYNLNPNETKSLGIESKVAIGDLLAISDGFRIVSIAKVLQKPAPIEAEWTENVKGIDFNNKNILGIKVEIVELDEEQQISYKKMGRFHQLHNDIRDKIIELWAAKFNPEFIRKEFYITARSSNLLKGENKDSILNKTTKYTIPIYQRPYSWGEHHLRRFVSDLHKSYIDSEGKLLMDPIFMGTIQLTKKKKHGEGNTFDYDVIDGQQRLSTILVMLKLLADKFPLALNDIQLDWLETNVDIQQNYLEEYLLSSTFVDENNYNPYSRNAFLISNLIEELFFEEGEDNNGFDIQSFKKHLLENVYFVVLETNAGLSKNLQIFDAINTTGLDLNGGDIFKIRMYEYLTDVMGYNEDAFETITKLYEKIEEQKKIVQISHIGITYILSIYKTYLIARYNLPKVLHFMGTDTFYERLFDTILNINNWEHFSDKAKDVKLSLDEIDRLIELRFSWEVKWQNKENISFDNMLAIHLIWLSRYPNAWSYIFLMYLCHGDSDTERSKINDIMLELSKLLSLYSVIYRKRVNEIHYRFLPDLINNIVEQDLDTVNNLIKKKIQDVQSESIDWKLSANLTDNAKRKRIICRLSAALDEQPQGLDAEGLKIIEKKIFLNVPSTDIEHITAINHVNVMTDDIVKSEWQEIINSLGNLILLESKINKSIKDKPTEDKKSKYAESKLRIVKSLLDQHWSPEQCKMRNSIEINKLKTFLFS